MRMVLSRKTLVGSVFFILAVAGLVSVSLAAEPIRIANIEALTTAEYIRVMVSYWGIAV